MQSVFKNGQVGGPLDRFSSEFRKALIHRYGRLPSAPFVAREFNLRHPGGRCISSESVRRWLQGDCLPHIDRLQTLAGWLGIRVDHIFLSKPPLEPYGLNRDQGAVHARHDANQGPETTHLSLRKSPLSSLRLSADQRDRLLRLLAMMFPELNMEDLFRRTQKASGKVSH